MMLSDQPVGPSGGQVPCSACGAIIDPLRAGHVAIFDSRFHYFCNAAVCRARFLGEQPNPAGGLTVPLAPAPAATRGEQLVVEAVTRPIQGAEATRPPDSAVPERIRVDEDADFFEPLPETAPVDLGPDAVPAERRDAGGVLVALAAIAGIVTMALDFADQSRLLLAARAVLALVGAAAIVGRVMTTRSDAAEVHRLAIILPPALAALLPLWALLGGGRELGSRASFFAGTMVGTSAACLWLVGLAARPVGAARRWLERQLDVPARRLSAEAAPGAPEPSVDLRPGELVAVEAGEVLPVDLEIREGEAEVQPWAGATHVVRRRPGDLCVAGARVVRGQLRGVCTCAGMDRAFARSLLSPERRCDVHAQLPRLSRLLTERYAWVAALGAAIMVTLLDWRHLEPIAVAMATTGVWAAIGSVAAGTVAALSVARGVRAAARRGIVYNRAETWDLCGRVTAAVFCARGTLLRGEPELAEVEPTGDSASAEELVALGAGALGTEHHPTAIALRRAARSRGIRPDAVRNPRSFAGLGVAAVASSGETVCVGSRELLLERRVSVAAAEQRVVELEATGRTVLLVSRAGRLLGLLAFQDGLRTGARAAVQHLVDAKIEPVLLSSDSQQTCEAIGRSLDIDHVRPEIAESERAEAVQRIKDTGAVAAVLGHSPFDDAALKAADVSVVLGGAGRAADDFSVCLASDDVRDAALGLAIAHRTRRQASQALGLVLGPALFGALVVTARLLPPEYAPLALLVGTATAVVHLRTWDRKLEPHEEG